MEKNKVKDPFAQREAANYENPIPSREYITGVLEKTSGPSSFKKLLTTLGIDSAAQKEALRRRLLAMERDGQLIINRRGEFGLTNKMDLVRGRVQGHRDGFGFVIPADGSQDVYLTSRQMLKVFDGDEVLVSPGRGDVKGRREGKIIEVLARNTHQLVGRYFAQGGNHFVRPDSPRQSHDIIIPPDHLNNAQSGQFVVVEITEYPDRNRKPVGRVLEVIGDHMAPGMEIDVAIRSNGIPHTWPTEVHRQASAFTAQVGGSDKQNRVDLRHLPLITIDGEDARDFDDAVYCEPKRSGGWRLFVAIADVSHYVPVGTPLDQEALVRGNSVYFPDFVVPMLPEVLSNGLCSLNPNVDRLCMVCEITVSAAGNISGYTFYEGLMHSHARMTYTQVGKIIDEKNNSRSGIRKQHHAVASQVDRLFEMYQALRATREQRGAIDFESKETRIVFDSERKIDKIIPIERNQAHRLIEECMLAANVCAAKFLEQQKVPALYRVHESPRAEKLAMLYEFLGELGVSMKKTDDITPQDYRQVLDFVAERPDAHLIQTVMLRSMNQARYQPENHGHFGLAYQAYTHFTSPIRRYPDLLVHRAIRALIRSDKKTSRVKRLPNTPRQALEKSYPYDAGDMVSFGEQCSLTERRADDATRDVISWLKCEFLREHVGQQYEGVVSSVTAFGLFVELNDLYIEGLVHITALPHDYYHFEMAQHRLIGERSRKIFRIGDQIFVQVARVDLDERKIDFEFVKVKRKAKKRPLEVSPKAKKLADEYLRETTPRNVRKRKPATKNKTAAEPSGKTLKKKLAPASLNAGAAEAGKKPGGKKNKHPKKDDSKAKKGKKDSNKTKSSKNKKANRKKKK